MSKAVEPLRYGATSILGAIFVVGYIVSGRVLRKWMPIFIYAFPVTLIGAIILIPASYFFEHEFSDLEQLDGFKRLLTVVSPCVNCGLLSHTGLNTCLRYMPPLVVSPV